MTAAKRVRPVSKPGKARPPRSAGEHRPGGCRARGGAAPGGKVTLTLAVSLSRAQADRLTARAISEGKHLDALVAEILEAVPAQPPT